MKVSFLAILAALVVSQVAFAAKIETCVQQLNAKCSVRFDWNSYLSRAAECKIVNYAGTRTNIIFFVGDNDRTLVAADVNQCTVAEYTLQSGTVTEQKVLEGRVFVTVSSGRAVLIGRNARILEFLNSRGESYKTVSGVTINSPADGGLVLSQTGGAPIPLSREQIQNRIDQNKLSVLAVPR